MNESDGNMLLPMHVAAEIVGHRRKVAGRRRRADGPSTRDFALVLQRALLADDEQADLRIVGRGDVLLGTERSGQRHPHVRLARTEPNLADQDVFDVELVVAGGDERPRFARRERLQHHLPGAVLAGPGDLLLVGNADRDLFAGVGRSPHAATGTSCWRTMWSEKRAGRWTSARAGTTTSKSVAAGSQHRGRETDASDGVEDLRIRRRRGGMGRVVGRLFGEGLVAGRLGGGRGIGGGLVAAALGGQGLLGGGLCGRERVDGWLARATTCLAAASSATVISATVLARACFSATILSSSSWAFFTASSKRGLIAAGRRGRFGLGQSVRPPLFRPLPSG